MRISVLQENLNKALGQINRIIPSRPQLPILQHVLLSVKNEGLYLTSTNMETSLQVLVLAKVEEEGALCVPSRLLGELVSSYPKDTLMLSLEGESLKVVCGRARATIPGLSPGEFPPFPEVGKNQGVDLDKEKLKSALKGVLFAATTDETRPLLMGVRIEHADTGTRFITTDGYRLSLKEIPGQTVSESTLLIPSRSLAEVTKLSEEEKEEKGVRMTETAEGQLLFTIGNSCLATRRIEGEFPNYQRIIPETYTTQLTMEKEEFGKAVKSASIFARDSSGIIKISVSLEEVAVSANTPQVGENRVEVEARVEGDGGEMAINSRFLLDFLSNFSGETILFQMTGSLNPAVFKNPEDDTFLHIIMPVRVQN